MAKARMLHKKISVSIQVNKLSLPAKLLFTWLIPHTDDEGRLKGEPQFIRAMVVPMTHWSEKKVKSYLEEIERVGLIHYWEQNGERFIEFPNWSEYQHIRKDRFESSKLPSFSGKTVTQLADKSQPDVNQEEAESSSVQSSTDKEKFNKSEFSKDSESHLESLQEKDQSHSYKRGLTSIGDVLSRKGVSWETSK